MPTDQVVALQPRLAGLLGGLTTGFLQQSRETILIEQEKIRGALTTALQQTHEALRKAYDEVEQRVQERTTELHAINEALQREIIKRKRSEEALRKAHDELEIRVQERTAELVQANEDLRIEITERKRVEEELRISHLFLEIAYRHTEMIPLLEDFVAGVKEVTGCAAVGIRMLDDEGNIPYEAYEGFSQRFYESESPLSIKSDQCTCINVIKRDTDPKLPYYTEAGSFYMNGTTRFLATVSQEEKGETRNVCNQFGYESVALVPMRVGGRLLGLIHVADPQENMVPLEMVRVLEGVMMQLGAAIQRVQAQEALRKSEERYRSLFGGVPVGLYRTTAAGQIVDANLALVQMLRYPDRESLLSANVADIYLNAEDRTRWQALTDRSGSSPDFETQCWRHDGRAIWVEDTGRVARDTNGRVLYYEGAVQDITKRKRVEEEVGQRNQELAARNQELALLLEATKAVSSTLDPQDVLQIMAQKLTELASVACSRIALLDETGENLVIHGAYPYGKTFDWDPRVGQLYPLTEAPWEREVIEMGKPVLWHREDSIVLSDSGQMISLGAEVQAVALLPVISREQTIGVVSLGERRGWERSPLNTGKVQLCQALINDMVMAIENARLHEETVQRAEQIARTERHLASVVESANDLVVSMDSEGRITRWNQMAKRISGFTSEEVIGKPLAALFDEEHQEDVHAMVEQVACGVPVKDRETALLARDGRHIPIAWSCSLMRDDENRVLGMVAVGRDLTERRKLEAQLIQSAKMASLGVLAGGIAHEIRNPLSVSSAAAQLFLENPEDEELKRECAERIYSGIKRTAKIVENLLSFARPAEGRKAPMDINEAIEETLVLLRHQILRQGIALEVHV